MRIAVTGATGFLGRYLVQELAAHGHQLRCWHRPQSDRRGFELAASQLEWLPGALGDDRAAASLVRGCEAVVHGALYHPGGRFRGGEGDVIDFVEKNVVGTLKLIEASRAAGAERFVFISSCAVHEKILGDRPLDEAHPLWAASHTEPTRGRSSSSSTATAWVPDIRSVPCAPPASMGRLTRSRRASGSTWFRPWSAARP